MADAFNLNSAITQQLQSLVRSGIRDIPCPNLNSATPQVTEIAQPTASDDSAEPGVETPSTTAAEQEQSPVRSLFGTANPVPAVVSGDARISTLQLIQGEVAACTRCSDLVRSRTQTVFGVGNPQPRLCFFGEAPGADEDIQGEPFVGRAGQLLNKIIAACKMKREDVYILNAIKCRPEGNRTPTDQEIENCWGYAERQLEILQPEFICCLGGVAVRSLLKRKESIGKLRQAFHAYRNSRVIVTYHPAYLLRNPDAKRFVWDDMQMLMREMGIPL